MADETVWIDLDEVEAAAKTIMGLLDELNGPANQLEAAVKQVQETVYGTDLLGKALQGSGSSVGGLAQHQEQVLAGIRTLMANATAMGQNLQTMAARHRATDEQHAGELGRITDTGAMPVEPRLTGGTVDAIPATLPDAPLAPLAESAPLTEQPPPPPPAVAPIGSTDPDVGYHDPGAPTLDYNHPDPVREALLNGGGPAVM